jgi:mannose-1-phosphate guanylyltransferase
MAGGSGERFWPLSRQHKPKQFLSLLGGPSLLQRTVHRAAPLAPPGALTILTSELLRETTATHCPGIPVIAEPARRDTGPAAALATALAWVQDPEAVVVLLPSDPWITDDLIFQEDLGAAISLASQEDSLVTVAVPPTHPATGFGYLELGEDLTPGPGKRVRRFVEKPDLTTAQGYLESGIHFWNAGIFVWRASVFVQEARRSCPELARFIESFPASGADTYIRTDFPALPKISVDFAIMEKARSVAAVPARFGWDDIGTWTALPAHLPADAAGNTLAGPVAVLESTHNIAISSGRTLALCGVEDLVIVETPDAVLVCHRSRVQDVKKLLPLLPPELH